MMVSRRRYKGTARAETKRKVREVEVNREECTHESGDDGWKTAPNIPDDCDEDL